MRTREEIGRELLKPRDSTAESAQIASLEVLLDIRELLTSLKEN